MKSLTLGISDATVGEMLMSHAAPFVALKTIAVIGPECVRATSQFVAARQIQFALVAS